MYGSRENNNIFLGRWTRGRRVEDREPAGPQRFVKKGGGIRCSARPEWWTTRSGRSKRYGNGLRRNTTPVLAARTVTSPRADRRFSACAATFGSVSAAALSGARRRAHGQRVLQTTLYFTTGILPRILRAGGGGLCLTTTHARVRRAAGARARGRAGERARRTDTRIDLSVLCARSLCARDPRAPPSHQSIVKQQCPARPPSYACTHTRTNERARAHIVYDDDRRRAPSFSAPTTIQQYHCRRGLLYTRIALQGSVCYYRVT